MYKRLEIRLSDIITYLKEQNIEYELVDNSHLNKYYLASIKNLVENGLYYVEDIAIISKLNPKNSLFLTSEFVETDQNLIIVKNPKLVHYKLSNLLETKTTYKIEPTAIISEDADIENQIYIGHHSVIGKARIEKRVVIKHNVVIEDNVTICSGSVIESNSVIGASGIAWAWDEGGNRVIQTQLGGVLIGQNSFIGTDVTIVRGSLSENTTIGNQSLLSHGTKIGHGCIVGNDVHMANNVSLAGNAYIGNECFLGSGCVISSNVKIPNNTIVGAGSLVVKNFENSFTTLAGVPAKVISKNNQDKKFSGVPKTKK